MGRRKTYEEEAYEYQQELWRKAMAARLSRGLVIRGSTLAALGGASALNALLAACAGGAQREMEHFGAVEPGRYTWSRYPLVERYNWRNLPWPDVPYVGGHEMSPSSPPNNWDLLRGPDIPPSGNFGNGLMHIKVGPGSDYDKSEVELDDIVERMEKSPDLSTWTFYLKRGVRFHPIPPVNGREMTADDVVYSFEKYRTDSLFTPPLEIVDKIEALDRYTVRFTLKRPVLYFDFNVGLANYLIFAREHLEAGEDLWRQQPILTGAHYVTRYAFRDRVEAVRHRDYIGRDRHGIQLPYNDRQTWIYIADAAAGLAAFRTGQIDYTLATDVTTLEDVLATNPNTVVQVTPYWGTFPYYYIMNWKDPIFQDVRVRRALSMGLDRKKMIDVLYRGAAAPSPAVSYDFCGETDAPLLEETGPYMQYNPTEARRLLAEAGFERGLELEYLTSSASTDYLVLTKEMWAEIGVTLNFRETEGTVVTADRNAKRFKHLVGHGNIAAYELDAWVSQLYLPDSPKNWGSVNDPVINDLIEKQKWSLDPDERMRIARQIRERAYDQMHHIWHVTPHVIVMRQPWHHNWANHLHSWYDSRQRWAHRLNFLDDTAPSGRGGRRAL